MNKIEYFFFEIITKIKAERITRVSLLKRTKNNLCVRNKYSGWKLEPLERLKYVIDFPMFYYRLFVFLFFKQSNYNLLQFTPFKNKSLLYIKF